MRGISWHTCPAHLFVAFDQFTFNTASFLPCHSHMGGCQNYGPFLGPYYNTAPNNFGYPKRDHNFDNHPHDADLLPLELDILEELSPLPSVSLARLACRVLVWDGEELRFVGCELLLRVSLIIILTLHRSI